MAAAAPSSPADNAAHAAAAFAGIDLLVKNAAAGDVSADGTPWAHVTTKEDLGLVVHSCAVPGSSYLRFRATCTLPHPPEAVSAFLADCPRRLAWDSNVSRLDATPVEDGPRGRVLLLHSQTKPVGPISARDFVDAVAIVTLPGGAGLANGGASVTDARFPEQKGVVRGWNSPGGGWVFAPAPQPGGAVHTRVSYVIHSNLRGYLPAFVINSALTGSYVSFFTDLKAAMAAAQAQADADAAAAGAREA